MIWYPRGISTLLTHAVVFVRSEGEGCFVLGEVRVAQVGRCRCFSGICSACYHRQSLTSECGIFIFLSKCPDVSWGLWLVFHSFCTLGRSSGCCLSGVVLGEESSKIQTPTREWDMQLGATLTEWCKRRVWNLSLNNLENCWLSYAFF